MVLDLSGVDFSGQTVTTRLEVGAGDVSVIVPPTVDVVTDLDLGAGVIQLFGSEHDGFGVSERLRDDGTDGPGGGTLNLEIEQGLGKMEVRRAAA